MTAAGERSGLGASRTLRSEPRALSHNGPMPSRMNAVQAPIIPIVGELIRTNPGTISLGQGMVSWGPPPEALDAARDAAGLAASHRYGPVEGSPALIAALGRKLRVENALDLEGSRILV